MSPPICKYFLQGNCHFGENCRFIHPSDQKAGSFCGATSNQTNRADQLPPSNEVINAISLEMSQWEACKLWTISCFGYSKHSQSLPGMVDISPEEVRDKAYECYKNNNPTPYLDWLKKNVTEAKERIKELSNPSAATRQILMQYYNTLNSASGSPGVTAAPSSNNNQTSTFGQNKPGSQGAFGASPLLKAGSVFGGSSTAGGGGSVFGGGTGGGGSVLGGGGGGTGVFGGSTGNAGQSSSVFGQTSAFAANSSGIANTSQPSVFGNQPSQPSGGGSVFANSNPSTQQPFGNPTPDSSGFATSAVNAATPSSVFGAGGSGFAGATAPAAPPSGLFGGASQNSPLNQQPVASNSVFGGTQSPTKSVFGSASGAVSSPMANASAAAAAAAVVTAADLYMAMDKLTSEEVAAFQDSKFISGKVPTNPPPKELC